MINKTMSQAKHDFQIGYLTKYRIERVSMSVHDWMVILGEGNSESVLVDAQRKQIRLFKSIDGAVAALHDIGFEINLLS